MTEQQNDHQKGKGVTYTERWLAEGLLRLTPRRTYIREEVESLMATLTGVVIEGMPLLDYRIEEAPLWFEVMVNLEDWSIEGGVSNDIWHFFKAAREQNTSGGEPLQKSATAIDDKVLSSEQERYAASLGQQYAESHTTDALVITIKIYCQEQGWARDSAEEERFEFLAGAAYHRRRKQLHPQEYPNL